LQGEGDESALRPLLPAGWEVRERLTTVGVHEDVESTVWHLGTQPVRQGDGSRYPYDERVVPPSLATSAHRHEGMVDLRRTTERFAAV
jgi:hypothetical protein